MYFSLTLVNRDSLKRSLLFSNCMVRRETGLSPPVKYSYWPFQGGAFLRIIYVISVLSLLCFCAPLFINALWSPAGKVLTSWLSFELSSCEVVFFLLVSWVRCGA